MLGYYIDLAYEEYLKHSYEEYLKSRESEGSILEEEVESGGETVDYIKSLT